jgi:hypothetical protein
MSTRKIVFMRSAEFEAIFFFFFFCFCFF